MEQLSVQKGKSKLKYLPAELAYGAIHLARSFEQKRKANVAEAQDFLLCLTNNLPKQNPYFIGDENLAVDRKIDSGFHSACYEFSSSTGRWVIKIGHDKSPMRTKFHPSKPEYADNYLRNLEIQRLVFSDKLPNFIPEPQGVFYIKGQNRATTLIIQPFVDYISPFSKKINLSQEERQQLMGEFKILEELLEEMRENCGVMPDFMRAGGKRGHLVIVRKADGVHLVMLDNGAYDEKEDSTPLLHSLNKKTAKRSIEKQRKRLET